MSIKSKPFNSIRVLTDADPADECDHKDCKRHRAELGPYRQFFESLRLSTFGPSILEEAMKAFKQLAIALPRGIDWPIKDFWGGDEKLSNRPFAQLLADSRHSPWSRYMGAQFDAHVAYDPGDPAGDQGGMIVVERGPAQGEYKVRSAYIDELEKLSAAEREKLYKGSFGPLTIEGKYEPISNEPLQLNPPINPIELLGGPIYDFDYTHGVDCDCDDCLGVDAALDQEEAEEEAALDEMNAMFYGDPDEEPSDDEELDFHLTKFDELGLDTTPLDPEYEPDDEDEDDEDFDPPPGWEDDLFDDDELPEPEPGEDLSGPVPDEPDQREA